MPRMADGAPAPGTTFEGPEKTLEIDFVPETWTPPSDGDAGGSASLPPRRSGLRAISRATLDSLLTAAVKEFGEKNWKAIADRVPQRTDSQCLHRWTKVLNPWYVFRRRSAALSPHPFFLVL